MSELAAVQNVLDKVSKQAKDEIVGTLEAALEESQGLMVALEKETKKEVQSIMTEAQRQAETRSRRIAGEAEISARNKSLQLVELTLNSVFEKGLSLMKNDQYSHSEELLEKLLRESLQFVQSGEIRINLTQKDSTTLSRILPKISKETGVKMVIDEKPLDSPGGLRVSSFDGSISYDNTFEARLERVKPVLRRKLSAILSGEA